jgi:hypothetical protein
MTKHTPGPWTALQEPSLSRWRIGAGFAAADSVAAVYATNVDGITEANARLIAAAPELLDALRALHAFASRMVERHGMNGDDSMTDADHAAWQDSASLANIAIAKATND